MTSNEASSDRDKPVMGYPQSQNPPPQSSYPLPPQSTYPPPQSSYPPPPPYNNVAYPYSAPPPPPASYFTQNPHPHPPPYQPYFTPRRSTFFRRMVYITIALLAILAFITFIMWLVLRPKLPEISVTTLTVAPFNVTSTQQLTATWDVTLYVKNVNKKMNMYFDRVGASMFFENEELSDISLAPFYMGTRNETTLKARLVASGNYVDDRAVRKMADERTKGEVEFNLRVLALVRFRSGAWRTRRHSMRVICGRLRVGFGAATRVNEVVGTLNGGAQRCRVVL